MAVHGHRAVGAAGVGRAGVTPDQLPPDWRERYDERAAIREYDGNRPRAEAESEAMQEILAMMEDDGDGPQHSP